MNDSTKILVNIKTESGIIEKEIDPLELDYMKSSMFECFLYMIDGTVYHVMEDENKLSKRISENLKQRGLL